MRYFFIKILVYIKRIFCKHDWSEYHCQLVDAGRNKLFWLKCDKCGKRTLVTLDSKKKRARPDYV